MSESYISDGWVVRRTLRTDEYSLLLPFSMVWEVKVVTGGMLLTFREKTREEWRDAWATSGKSCRKFAAEVGVKPATLAWWKWRLGRVGGEARPLGRADFVEVSAPVPEVGVIELDVAGTTVRIRGRVEAEALAPVLQALEGADADA